MPPIHFKLTKSDGHTRRATFPQLPSWNELAAKLQALYDIPVEKLGVSYVDSDNDEITASSNEELQDFYQSSYTPGSPIKFNVLDLTAPRDEAHNVPPLSSLGRRNTFGQDHFEFEEGWQVPSALEFLGAISEGPHAFVEVLSSDASGIAKEHDDIASDTDSDDAQSTIQQASYADKGKQRASSFDAASTMSVLEEEAAEKFPVHVFDHSTFLRQLSASKSEQGEIKPSVNVAAESTPKASAEDLKTPEAPATSLEKVVDPTETEDPPLPSLDTPAPNTALTLSHDVAALLTTFTQVISSHPELSEGVRNIVRNATSGTYWQVHRSALSQVVSDLSQAGVEISQSEAEAGQRVADALGHIFRSFSLAGGSADPEASQPATTAAAAAADSTSAQATQGDSEVRDTPALNNHRLWSRRSTTALDAHRRWSSPWHVPPWSLERIQPFYGGPPPPGPPPGIHPFGHFLHGPHPFPPPPPPHHSHHMPPPPPPPHAPRSPRENPQPPPPMSPVHMAATDKPSSNEPSSNVPLFAPPSGPPPPGPMPGPMPYPPNDNPPPRGPRHGPFPPHHQRFFSMRGHNHRHGGFLAPPPPPPLHGAPEVPPAPPAPASGPSSVPPPPPQFHPFANPFFTAAEAAQRDAAKIAEQNLREGIENSKRAYRAQKEAYRQLREERRKAKEERRGSDGTPKMNLSSDTAAPVEETSQIVGAARDGFPQLEVYSAGGPRRYNTHLGHGSSTARRSTDRKPEDLLTRAQSRIAKRLADMGFSEISYPDLPAKIKAEMPANGVISKDGEDDVVTTLLEELLARSARSPVASGSKDLDNMAGAWH